MLWPKGSTGMPRSSCGGTRTRPGTPRKHCAAIAKLPILAFRTPTFELGSFKSMGSVWPGVRVAALPGSLRHPVSGRDPQEGDDDDRDSSFGHGWFGPGWAQVAPAQA